MNAKIQALIKIAADGIWTSPGMDFPKFLQLTLSAILQIMKAQQDNVDKDPKLSDEFKKKFKEDLYDSFNQAASSVLQLFAPEFELRPDLTADAILAAENAIMDQKIAAGDVEGAAELAGMEIAPEPVGPEPPALGLVPNALKKKPKVTVVN